MGRNIRFNDVRTDAELDEVRIPIWVCRLSAMGLLDVREPAVRRLYQLSSSDLTADDWTACQRAATAMRSDGARGILSPSAALANTINVTLFGPRRAIAFERRPALASAVPATIVAIGRPPKKLVNRVIRSAHAETLF